MSGARAWIARVPPWSQALVAGAASATALPPLDVLPALLAYGWLLWLLLDARSWPRAWRLSVLFVFAQAAAGLHWVAIAFTVDAERFGALAVPAVALLCLGIALIQGSVSSVLALRRWQSPLAAALVFAPLWLLGEALRGWIGQFPWNLIGYAFAGWLPLAQGAALGSVWWLGWLAVLLGTAPVVFRIGRIAGFAWLGVLVVTLGSLTLWGQGRLGEPTRFTETRLRLVQAGFALDHGFDPERMRTWFFEQVRWSQMPADRPLDAILWSEGASPYRLDVDTAAREVIADLLVRQSDTPWLLTGGDRLIFDAQGQLEGVTNSLFAIGHDGAVGERYDKVDLVPFGEFLPFRSVLGALGLDKLTAGSVDYARGPARRTLNLEGLPPFSPLICYETIFAGRVIGPTRPEWLLNVTIDTWFGDSIGPHQHLAMARMRAIEEGLPLIRVANSGISASIDAHGRILARLDLDEVGVLDVLLPAMVEKTLFARNRWLLLGVAVAFGLLLAASLEVISTRRRT